eukprot:3384495-Prymnesium_polylepis.2
MTLIKCDDGYSKMNLSDVVFIRLAIPRAEDHGIDGRRDQEDQDQAGRPEFAQHTVELPCNVKSVANHARREHCYQYDGR